MKTVLFFLTLIASAATNSTAEARIHEVAPGETLFSIAQAELGSGARWSEIARVNGLVAPYVIRVGTRLTLPDSPSSVPRSGELAEDTSILRRVPPGEPQDTPSPTGLFGIAAHDSIPPRALPPWSIGEVMVPMPEAAVALRSTEQAVEMARRENADIRALASEIERARAGRTSASLAGRFNPEVEGAFGRRVKPNEVTQGTDRFNEWGVDIWQELEIAGQRPLRLTVAELEIERAIAESERAEREILLEVREAYWEAIATMERMTLAIQEENSHVWMADAARYRYEAGDVAMIEVTLAEANAEQARAERIRAEQDLKDALSRLGRSVGLPADSNVAPLAPFPEIEPVADRDWEGLAQRYRRDLRAEAINIRLESERSRLALAEGAPNLRVGFGYEREEGTTDVYTAKIGIPLPLTNVRRGDAEASRAASRAAESRSEALRRRVAQEARIAAERLKSAQRRNELVRRGVIARADDNLALAAQAYAEGKIGLPAFLTHFEQASENRRLGVETRLEWQRALLNLERAIGVDLNQLKGEGR